MGDDDHRWIRPGNALEWLRESLALTKAALESRLEGQGQRSHELTLRAQRALNMARFGLQFEPDDHEQGGDA